MPSFHCPHCTQHIDADDELVGTTSHCPTCGGELQVPVVQEPPAVPPGSLQSSPPRKRMTTHQQAAIYAVKGVTPLLLAVRLLCIAAWSTAGLAAEPGGRSRQVRLDELSHSSPEVRIAALRDLQTSLDPRIPEAMIPLLADEGTSIRRLAARAIGSRWWQIPKERIPAYLTALGRNQRHERSDIKNMTARAIGLLKRDYRGEMFARSRNKRWVVYERRGHPCLIDIRIHTEELLGWSDKDPSSLSPRMYVGNMPMRANSVLWHPRKEFVAFRMYAGRRPLGVWVWRHREGLRKIEHAEIIKTLAIGPNMKPALYILDLHGWHGDELRFSVDVGLLGTKMLGWSATSGVLRELSPGPKKDGR